MQVNESNHNHLQSLSPIQQKAVQDLMTMKFLQEMYDKNLYYIILNYIIIKR